MKIPCIPAGGSTPQHSSQTPCAGPSSAGMDWAKAAQILAKRPGNQGKPGTPKQGQSPRGMRPSPRPSPRHGGGETPGDATPLFDER